MGHVVPVCEQQCPLEQKLTGKRRMAQPVKDALKGKAHQHLIVVSRIIRFQNVRQISGDCRIAIELRRRVELRQGFDRGHRCNES